MSLKVGDILTFQRTFTERDVELFTEISGDRGIHHITPDAQGRYVVQGLLTATLPTKIGGDHNVLARTMNFEFFRPVYTGDTINCEVKIEKYERQENNRTAIQASFLCKNQHGKEVLKGDFAGVIFH
ncbi:FAS1-like dehydratase domain-containing protein [Calidifontibacillus erzurumensis]|uniref:MaoC family dehydratase N-terminal domain-containing protein n=1 Tax=Calidifontibacillus erzurumensis TaxID=2741433 RepID=A0A8J8KC96_9BACI|nr:MaoC family dehydratase N-terminal domain-containing protein [Calidifontibacillus erzurumensis]NSL52402.1 MaoC family dehydratase N-terminal domain-containing protein [Calidifontibacillus erzurumensis]